MSIFNKNIFTSININNWQALFYNFPSLFSSEGKIRIEKGSKFTLEDIEIISHMNSYLRRRNKNKSFFFK
jgi:hypothetical protein